MSGAMQTDLGIFVHTKLHIPAAPVMVELRRRFGGNTVVPIRRKLNAVMRPRHRAWVRPRDAYGYPAEVQPRAGYINQRTTPLGSPGQKQRAEPRARNLLLTLHSSVSVRVSCCVRKVLLCRIMFQAISID